MQTTEPASERWNKVSDANVTAETLLSLCFQPLSTTFLACPRLKAQHPVCISTLIKINLYIRCMDECGCRYDQSVDDLLRAIVLRVSRLSPR
jgi:hypothetical protein